MVYKLSYHFDSGSGICLWTANDAATDYFANYVVPSSKLPITLTLKHRVEFVLAWYDTFLNWENPKEGTRWREIEWNRFSLAAQELLDLLRKELGPEFVIVDESRLRQYTRFFRFNWKYRFLTLETRFFQLNLRRRFLSMEIHL